MKNTFWLELEAIIGPIKMYREESSQNVVLC